MIVPLHFGHLPLWEQVAVIALAIVPFIVLGVVMVVVQRRDAVHDTEHRGTEHRGTEHHGTEHHGTEC